MTQPRDEDAAWREIVDHFGDRAELEDAESAAPDGDPRAGATPGDPGSAPAWWRPEAEDRFVPPEPPAATWPTGPRLAGWLGIFAAPLILLVCLILSIRLPFPLGQLLVAWFVGGFAYLVWTMPRGPRDPWDDGSRV